MPRKPFKFGRKAQPTPSRECDTCGGPMKATPDGVSVCLSCSGREKRRKRMADKAESMDRDEDDDERAEFRDSYLGLLESE